MLTSPARLCWPCCLAGPAHPAATAGFSIREGEIPRETDCLLEEDGFELPVRSRGKPGYRPFCAAQAPSRSHSVATNASSSTGSRDRRSARISPLAQCGISNRHRICRPSRIPISTLLRRFRTGILCGDELAGAGRRIQTLAFSGASAFGGTRECQICLPCAWPHRPSAAPARPNTSW